MFGEKTSVYLNSLLYKSSFIDYFVYFFAETLPIILFIFITLYFLFFKKKYKFFLHLSLVILFSWAFSEILKYIFSYPRPFLNISDFSPLFIFGGNDSFPSGHAMVFSSIGTAIYFENKKLGIVFYIFAILISFARVFSGVHYLSDVLAGLILGSLTIILAYKYIGKLRNNS